MGDFCEKCENEQKVRLFAKKRTFPARGGNPSIAQHILMVLGAQSALWGKKCVFSWKWWNFMKFMEISLFSWKSWKLSILEVKITPRNGHLSNAKSTFSFSGGNFQKFHEISWNFMKFHEISWIYWNFAENGTFPARGGNPSIAQHILMVLGTQFRPKVHFGAKSSKMEDFSQFFMIFTKFH